MTAHRLILASTSPRRRQMLAEAGIPHDARSPGIDDGPLHSGRVTPDQWVSALAYLKARSGLEQSDEDEGAVFLGADTVVVKGDALVGQPRDVEDAGDIIRLLRCGEHRVVTGIALVTRTSRFLLVDAADVRVGDITDAMIDAYLASGTWQGKAGAYNLAERMADGWPLHCTGDPATVMGLPMRRLPGTLASLGFHFVEGAAG